MGREREFSEKRERIFKYLESRKADGALLGRVDNFAWAGCGASTYVNTASETGVAWLLLIDDKSVVVTNRIEEARLLDEELTALPVEVDALPWQADVAKHVMQKYIGNKNILADAPFGDLPLLDADFIDLHAPFTEEEMMRYRALGGRAGHALQETCKIISAGMTENEIAGRLARRCLDAGMHPTVILVAADERIGKYRHPLPRNNKLRKTAMVVLCARRGGLIASCTRMVSVGVPSQELIDRHAACVLVDVNFNVNTMPGRRVGDIFSAALESYRAAGCDGEWNLHHQGGPTGYRGRYYFATENCDDIVAPRTAYAWNPSVTGAKSEDTLLVFDGHNELITQAPDWPQIELECEHLSLSRPDILVV